VSHFPGGLAAQRTWRRSQESRRFTVDSIVTLWQYRCARGVAVPHVAGGFGAPGGKVSLGTALGPVVADLRQVFLDLPQPVAVITGLTPSGEPVGMTVSSLTSASRAPPLVLFWRTPSRGDAARLAPCPERSSQGDRTRRRAGAGTQFKRRQREE
jgi:hypothetical protein